MTLKSPMMIERELGKKLNGEKKCPITQYIEYQHRNLIVFDWDDTLLPSTWLIESNLTVESSAPLPLEHREVLDALAMLIEQTLTQAQSIGTVIIVTNAQEGWIEMSCNRFFPTLWKFLSEFSMYSARAFYHQNCTEFVMHPTLWKKSIFDHILLEFSQRASLYFSIPLASPANLNVLSIGDSYFERDAMFAAARGTSFFVKTLKFMDRPSIFQLFSQHQIIIRNLVVSKILTNLHVDAHFSFT